MFDSQYSFIQIYNGAFNVLFELYTSLWFPGINAVTVPLSKKVLWWLFIVKKVANLYFLTSSVSMDHRLESELPQYKENGTDEIEPVTFRVK